MQSNPIQQRIELICEKWEEAKKYTLARIVRIQCQRDEVDMVDTFYTYMIGTDTPVLDIAFHFDSACTDIREFSLSLLNELEEIMHIWNNSQKDERIEYVPVHWKPDYALQKDKNAAAMFVENFNRLAKELSLPDGLFTVAIFKGAAGDKNFIGWLRDAIKLNISPAVKYLIHDVVSEGTFDRIAIEAPLAVTTIPINLDMPKVMEQVAAMGDPKDPATGYRHVFMKMMTAMGAGDQAGAEQWGNECIAIASLHLSKDPYWIMQVIVVYTALGNDKIRYRKKEETLAYAEKAFQAAVASKAYFDDEVSAMLLAQTLMFRGTVFFMQGASAKAFSDFNTAFKTYSRQGNMPLAIEACRMAGKSALKISQTVDAVEMLATGARLGQHIDPSVAHASTYAGLLELLLQTNYGSYISVVELHEIAARIYGPDWGNVISNWKKSPAAESVKQQELEAAKEDA